MKPIFQICSALSEDLADKVRKQFEYTDRKQMIFELLGQDFVRSHFPAEPQRPDLLVSLKVFYS